MNSDESSVNDEAGPHVNLPFAPMSLLHEAPLSPFFAAMTTRIFLYLGDDATVADSVLLTEVTVDHDASSLVRVRSRVGFEQPMAMARGNSKVRYRI